MTVLIDATVEGSNVTVEVPRYEVTVNAVGPAGPSGSRSRQTTALTTPSLAPAASSTGLVRLSTGYVLYHIQTSHPCRTRLYTSISKRDADLTRPVGTYPSQDSGLMLEYISTPALLQGPLAPAPVGYLHPAPPAAPHPDANMVPFTVTSNHTSATAITVTLTWVEMEY